MKTLKRISALVLLLALSIGVKAQQYDNERLNLPGDNLNLYAVMNLFQESETLEGFERNLNSADSKVNNLDLNGDNMIDYIKVIDYADGTTHTIVLQVAINQKENQDVAVFTVYRDRNDQVQIQLVGDEYLYGKNYIIEPFYAETPNPGYTGNTRVVNSQPVVVNRTTYVEVRTWPVVRYIYTPTYVVYRSPWYWNYYPVYWTSWRPYYWDYYYGYHSHWHNHYYSHYRYTRHYYNDYYAHNYYNGHRNYSNTVRSYESSGRYKETYSRPDLRSKGSDEGRRVYASAVQTTGRAGGQNTGRNAQDINQRKAADFTPTTGRTIVPGTGRQAEINSGRQEAPRGTTTPSVGRESGGTKAVPQNNRTTKPAISPTTGNQRKEVAPARQEAKPQKTQTPVKSAPQPAVRSSQGSQSGQVTPPRQEVKTQKTQAPTRSASSPAVKSNDNKSSRSGQAVKSSSRQTPSAAPRQSAPARKSSSVSKSSGSGR